jgi:hypothetical protein
MSEDDIGVPSPSTPSWWLTEEQRLKYRGPKTWERNRAEIEAQRGADTITISREDAEEACKAWQTDDYNLLMEQRIAQAVRNLRRALSKLG